MSYKERAFKQRESEIVQHALRLIGANGWTDFRLDDLAEAVGISKPTLYQHFKNKDDLIAALMLHSYDQLEEHLHTLHTQPPLAQLQEVLRWMLHQRYQYEASFADMSGEIFARVAHTHTTVIERRAVLMAQLHQRVLDGQEQGTITQQFTAQFITAHLFCLFQLPRLAGKTVPLETVLEQVVTLFTRAIQPDP